MKYDVSSPAGGGERGACPSPSGTEEHAAGGEKQPMIAGEERPEGDGKRRGASDGDMPVRRGGGIADRRPDPNRKRGRGLAAHLRGLAVGAVVGVAMLASVAAVPCLRDFFKGEMTSGGMAVFMLYWLAGMAVLVLVAFVQVVLHEAGHLACGLASGYRFVSFRVGGAMLYRDDTGFHFGRFGVAGTGGQCLLEPPADDAASAGAMPFRAYCMGGVAANLAAAAVAAAALALFPAGVFWSFAASMTAFTGVALAAMNGIPMVAGGIPNDGCNARIMGRDACMRRMLWVQLKVNALYSRGRMLRDMPDEWFRLPAGADLSNHMYATVAMFDCSRRVELRDFEGAMRILARIEACGGRMIPLFRREAACERMFVAVMLRRPRAEVERIFTPEVERYAKADAHYQIGHALCLYAWERFVARDASAAAERAAAVRAMAPKYPVRGEAAACVGLLDEMENMEDETYASY